MARRPEIVKRARRIKRQRQARRLTTICLGLLLLLAAAVFFSRSKRWLLQSVIVEGNQAVSVEEVRAAVLETLAGNYWLILPRRNVLWYPAEQVKARLLNRFPQLKTVKLKTPDLTTLEVLVEERRGEFVWCSSETSGVQSEENRCYLVDETGLLFAPAPRLTSPVFLEIVGPLPAPPLGQRPLPETEFRRLLEFKNQLTEWLGSFFAVLNLRPLSVYRLLFGELNDLAFQFKYPEEAPRPDHFRIVFSLEQDLAAVFANLRPALAAPDLQNAFRAAPLRLEYIDLRFPPKVFYKIRQ